MAFSLHNSWVTSERRAARCCIRWAEGGSTEEATAERLRRKFRRRRNELLRWARKHSVPGIGAPGWSLVLNLEVGSPYRPPTLDEDAAAQDLFFEVFARAASWR